MDPNACLVMFVSAVENDDLASAQEHHCDLTRWLNQGGFQPDWDLDPENLFSTFNQVS